MKRAIKTRSSGIYVHKLEHYQPGHLPEKPRPGKGYKIDVLTKKMPTMATDVYSRELHDRTTFFFWGGGRPFEEERERERKSETKEKTERE